jgi:PGF-CTERM protein
MNRVSSVVAVVFLVGAVAVVPMGVAADTTTLTVAVETRDGTAVGGATIVATWENGSSSATTANNGKAFLDVPDGERVELTVEHEEYTRNFPKVIPDTATASDEITVAVGAKSSLSVTVADGDGPVEDAQVAIRWNGRIVKAGATDADGGIETTTIEAGSYSVNVLKQGYYEKRVTVDVAGDSSETVTVQSGSVPYEFNVTDSHFDPARPVPEATIALEGIGSFKTVQDGLATGRIPVNTEVEMTVTKDGYETVTRTLTVEESGETVAIDLQRTPTLTVVPANQRVVAGESVIVTVQDEYGQPVADATVRRNGTDVATTDANGQTAIPLDQPGTYELSATASGVTSDGVTVEAISGETRETTTTTTTATTTSTTDPTTTTTDVDIPGFGVLVALLGLLASTLLARRVRHGR